MSEQLGKGVPKGKIILQPRPELLIGAKFHNEIQIARVRIKILLRGG